MAFFEISINSCKEHSIESKDFKFLEIGLISVGPRFDIDLLCNGIYKDTNESISILNKKIAVDDIVDINYYSFDDEYEAVSNKILKKDNSSYTAILEKHTGNKVRLFRVDIDDGRHFVISATKNTTLLFDCIWLKKDNKCTITLGNTNDDGNEQWLKTLLEINRQIKIQAG